MSHPLSIAITGAGGAGVISVGELLLQAWAAAGGYGLLRKPIKPAALRALMTNTLKNL